MPDFTKLLSTIPSWDIIIIVGSVAVIFFYGWTIGKNRLFAALFSIYISYAIALSVPWDKITFIKIKPSELSNYQIFIFLAIGIALMFLLPHSGIGSPLKLYKRIQGKWYEVLIFSLLQVGLLVSLILSFLPEKILYSLHPLLINYFTGEQIKFLWLSVPIIALMIIGRKSSED